MDKNGFYTLSVPGRPLASHPRVSNCFLQGCPRGSQEREKHRARQRREEKRLGNRAFEGKKKSKGEGEEGRKRRARGWPLLQEIHHHNFTAHEAAVLCGALNSSGQYTLSSGIINTDVVARGAGRRWAGGAAPRSGNNGQPALCVHTKEPGKASSRGLGAKRALGGC